MGRSSFVLLVLSLLATSAKISAQSTVEQRPSGDPKIDFTLGQNYPNPSNPETRIPFDLHETLFNDGGTALVSMRIYNVLLQFVASPLVGRQPNGLGPLIDLEYSQPGRHEAYWDGRDHLGRAVASGTYFGQLRVNGAMAIIRMYVN
tara:strand:- start:132 stop:572 length:441 start_codon:yes stop_codon:yes gene_type:complete